MKAEWRNCPVEGCSLLAATRTTIRVHFWHRHFQEMVVILEEGNFTHSHSPLWEMLMPWQPLNVLNNRTSQCKKELERKRWSLEAEGGRLVTQGCLVPMGAPLDMVSSLKYLGIVILAVEDDCPEVFRSFFYTLYIIKNLDSNIRRRVIFDL